MKFTCLKQNLEHAFTIAERFTGKNFTLPILGSLLLEAKENTLTVTATNLEHAIQITIPGNTTKIGRVSIPAKIASALVQSIDEEKVVLEEKNNSVVFKTDSRDVRLNGTIADDFPLIPKIKTTASFDVNASLLGQGLGKVLPAVSLSEFKPEFSGVFFQGAGQTLHLVATDTFRLAEQAIHLEKKIEDGNISFILPHKVAQELSRALGGSDSVRVVLGENQALFETQEMRIISRCIEGNFPDYAGIIPKRFEATVFLNRESITNAVRTASILASKLQAVTLAFGDDECAITSANQEVGEYKTHIPAPLAGKKAAVSFNYRYLLDGLHVLEGDEIFFGINNESAPSLLHEKDNSTLLYVIMPIHVA